MGQLVVLMNLTKMIPSPARSQWQDAAHSGQTRSKYPERCRRLPNMCAAMLDLGYAGLTSKYENEAAMQSCCLCDSVWFGMLSWMVISAILSARILLILRLQRIEIFPQQDAILCGSWVPECQWWKAWRSGIVLPYFPTC